MTEDIQTNSLEFKPWPKIPRISPFKVTITEKMDGTNACIVIKDGDLQGIQSRKRFISPGDDNYGFAHWVHENWDQLKSLGDGHHYGEWVGGKIQKNPHNLDSKEFYLFNTFRWNENNPNLPEICKVVPILFEGEMDADTIDVVMSNLNRNSPEGVTPEGVICYYHAFRKYTKHTFAFSGGKWRGK